MLKRTQSLSWQKTPAKSRKEVPITEAVTLSTKKNKASKKNSWVDKDLTKSSKKKSFVENRAVWNAKKNRTTKTWVEEDLSKFLKTRRH